MILLGCNDMSENPDLRNPEKDTSDKLTVAYVRVSKMDQDSEHQIRRYLAMGIPSDLIFIDQGTSGAKHHTKRPQFRRLNSLLEKDIIGELWVSELTRLGRDTLSTIEVLITLWNRDVTVHALNEDDERVLSAEPMFRPLMISAFSLAGDFERRHNMERTRIAIETARLRGVKLGRPEIEINWKKIEDTMAKYGVSMNMAARICGYTPSTLYRKKRERKADAEAAP